MKKNIISILFAVTFVLTSNAQEVRDVSVSAGTPYEESLSVQCDEKGLVLNLRLAYDENADILTLSVAPDRPVIFFRESLMYADVFSNKKLKTERIPYPVQVSPKSEYRLSSSVYKQYPQKRKNHIYNKWIGNISSDMKELPPEVTEAGTAAPLVTVDSLYRCFVIRNESSKLTFKLRNVVTADLVRKKSNGKSEYSLTGEQDLNITFNVTLSRNDCHGTGALRQALDNRIEEISKGYARLHNVCPEGIADSEQEVVVFNEHRQYLLSQFPPLSLESRCEDVLEACARYNGYVDSIRTAPCSFTPQFDLEAIYSEQDKVHSETLVTAARTINEKTIRLIVTKDKMEANDIIGDVKSVLNTVNSLILERGVTGDDKESAMKLFREAEAFWSNIAMKYGR